MSTSVIFLGTPELARTVLKGIIDADKYNILGVVTQPDKPVGRKQVLQKSPVKELAELNGIKVFQPEKLSGSDELKELIAMNPDFIITAAYGQFLPTSFLEAAKIGAINVHGSLLPKYRGGAPIQYSLLNGDKKTGITIMYMVKKMDAGDIISQKELPITDQDDNGSLFEKLAILGRDLLLDTLPKLENNEITPIQQNEDEVVFSPTISKEQEHLDFSKSAMELFNQIRALSPEPGSWVNFNGERTKIYKSEVVEISTDQNPGTVYKISKKEFILVAGDKQGLSIKSIQPSGKKVMDISNFINGVGNKLKEGQQIIYEN
ncbi:methionyl-tRNA formyltransferase [Companilactobacillus metriopterae]|uniref:methionyl-tRNA formyltransferase n=1 Tax=Companilactobacillus metriopterae TaxID=1909267 RepID=UPI00100B2AB1|nr:methionyl-tRNA formyltransferase [Companilactobacillus metriopterae]